MKKTFLLYDVETSGLNPAFDQILTFAAIRTDTKFTELGRETITIRLRKDIIPSPHACITHCLSPGDVAGGICEYQAALKLHALFNTPGTISIGYNSLGFDDEFLRFLFYRNLLDPYQHQYASGCGRADMLPVTALYKIFARDVVRWPVTADGKPSLKLEHISRENRFDTSGRAHDAMADVEALLGLCKALSKKSDVWAYALGLFEKNREIKRIGAIDKGFEVKGRSYRMGIMIAPPFGGAVNYMAPVIHIGDSIPYKNQSLWLRLDQERLFDIEENTDLFDWFPVRKKPADQWLVLPCLDRFWQRLTNNSRKTARANMERVQSRPEVFFKTIDTHLAYQYPVVPDIDPDAALYQSGFFSASEKQEMARFHDAPEDEKSIVYGALKSQRVKMLAGRILSRNYNPDIVPPEFTRHVENLLTGTGEIKGYKDDLKYTLEDGIQHTRELEENQTHLTPLQKRTLMALKAYLSELN